MGKQKPRKKPKRVEVPITVYSPFVLKKPDELFIYYEAEENTLALLLLAIHQVDKEMDGDALRTVLTETLETVDCIHQRLITYRGIEETIHQETGLDMEAAEAKESIRKYGRSEKLRYVALSRVSDAVLWALHNRLNYSKETGIGSGISDPPYVYEGTLA